MLIYANELATGFFFFFCGGGETEVTERRMRLKRAVGSGEEALNPQLPSGVCLHFASELWVVRGDGSDLLNHLVPGPSDGHPADDVQTRCEACAEVKYSGITGLGVSSLLLFWFILSKVCASHALPGSNSLNASSNSYVSQ